MGTDAGRLPACVLLLGRGRVKPLLRVAEDGHDRPGMLLLQPFVQARNSASACSTVLSAGRDPVFHHLLSEFRGAGHLDAEPEHGDLAELGIEPHLARPA